MSRKNEIDELFRNALGDKGMNFAPEYWEQMEALIAKRRKKVFKRVAWFSAVGLLLIMGLFLAIPWEMGSEERAFGQSGGAEGVESDKVADKDNMVRHTERSRSTTDLTDTTEDGETGGLQDEAHRPFAELVEVNGQRGKEPEGPMFSHENIAGSDIKGLIQLTPPADEENDIVRPTSAWLPTTDIAQISSISPLSLETLLRIAEIPTNPLQAQNPTKNLRRLPSYTQWYLGSYFNYGWIKHRYDPSIHTWKNTNEKVRPFMHYGINIRASKRGFSVSIGTGIRQWTERTNYTREIDHYTFDSSFRLINRNFIKRPDGTYAALVQKQIDTTSHTTTTEFICQDCPVMFRYITVPVAIHYEFGRGKWLGFTEAGMTFSFLSKSSGEYSVQWRSEVGKTPGMQTDDLSRKYMSPMVMQAGLTAGLSYRIHPFLSITGQFSYQRSLTSMMVLYRQESDFYGVGLGLEWKVF